MKVKRMGIITGFSLILIFLVSIVSVACAPKAVSTLAPTITVTKTATTTVTATPTAKPAEVYRWQPSTWASAGSVWDNLVYIGQYLDKMTDGRIEITPSQPGAICPVDQQYEAVSSGTTPAMAPTPPYYAGKIPIAYLQTTLTANWVHELYDFNEVYQNGAAGDMWRSTTEGMYNIKQVARTYYPVNITIASNKPINGIADLKGLKFRCGDECIADPLNAFGASTVWFPGTEIYTSMATHVVDAFTYGSAYDYISLSFQEVTKYWVKAPAGYGPGSDSFVVNRDMWNGMPADLQEMVATAVKAANLRVTSEGYARIADAWTTATQDGITVVEWSLADQKAWKAKEMEMANKFSSDPTYVQFIALVNQWSKTRGLVD